jgi:hypothetical protein
LNLIEFPTGYIFDHYTHDCLYHKEKSGAFMSLVAPFQRVTIKRARFMPTIRKYDHRQLVRKFEKNYTRIDTNEPMWLQVVHDKNHKNLMDRGRKTIVNPEDVFNWFAVTV